MKILQICLKPPFPEVDGGCKAMHAITQGFLDKNIEIKVLTISTPKHPFQKEKMPTSYLEKTKIEHVFINTKVTLLGSILNLFSSKSYNLERFYSKEFENLIVKTLKENAYDVVLLETFFVTGYIEVIRENCSAKIVYQAQNIEHDIWSLNAQKEKGLKRWYFKFLAKRLKIAEIENIQKVDGIAPITDMDKKLFFLDILLLFGHATRFCGLIYGERVKHPPHKSLQYMVIWPSDGTPNRSYPS